MARFSFDQLKRLGEEARAVIEERRLPFHGDDLTRTHKLAHFLVLVVKSFLRNRGPVRAAALAYTTVLALVPLLAVAVTITTSLFHQQERTETIYQLIQKAIINVAPALKNYSVEEGETTLEEGESNPAVLPADPAGETTDSAGGGASEGEASAISEVPLDPGGEGAEAAADSEGGTVTTEVQDQVSEETAIASWRVAQEIQGYIKKFNSGALTASAVMVLLFLAVTLLSTVEDTLNDMWGVSQGRSWFTRIVQYWAAISLGPALLVAAATLLTASQFQYVQEWVGDLRFLGWLVLQFVPFVILSLTCCLLYLLMPNTKVSWRAAVIGGAVGGLGLFLNNKLSVLYVVENYRSVYGIIGIIPIFMIGLYISWLIVLFGAQVAYGVQNWRVYVQERQAERVNHRGREFVALRLMTYSAQQFHRGLPAPGVSELAAALGIPMRLVTQVVTLLENTRLLVEVKNSEPSYFPARPLHQITVFDVLQAVRTGTGQELATADDSARRALSAEVDAVTQAERTVAEAVTFQELVERLNQTRIPERVSSTLEASRSA